MRRRNVLPGRHSVVINKVKLANRETVVGVQYNVV